KFHRSSCDGHSRLINHSSADPTGRLLIRKLQVGRSRACGSFRSRSSRYLRGPLSCDRKAANQQAKGKPDEVLQTKYSTPGFSTPKSFARFCSCKIHADDSAAFPYPSSKH